MKPFVLCALFSAISLFPASLPPGGNLRHAFTRSVTKGSITLTVNFITSVGAEQPDTLAVYIRSSNPDNIPELLLRASFVDVEGNARTKDQIIHTFPSPVRDGNRDDLAYIYLGGPVRKLLSLEVTEQRPPTVFSLDGLE